MMCFASKLYTILYGEILYPCPSVCPPARPPACLSASLPVCLPACLSATLSEAAHVVQTTCCKPTPPPGTEFLYSARRYTGSAFFPSINHGYCFCCNANTLYISVTLWHIQLFLRDIKHIVTEILIYLK